MISTDQDLSFCLHGVRITSDRRPAHAGRGAALLGEAEPVRGSTALPLFLPVHFFHPWTSRSARSPMLPSRIPFPVDFLRSGNASSMLPSFPSHVRKRPRVVRASSRPDRASHQGDRAFHVHSASEHTWLIPRWTVMENSVSCFASPRPARPFIPPSFLH
jgi:hypothetical protein